MVLGGKRWTGVWYLWRVDHLTGSTKGVDWFVTGLRDWAWESGDGFG